MSIMEVITKRSQQRMTRFRQRLSAHLEAEKSVLDGQKTVDSYNHNYYYGGEMKNQGEILGDRKGVASCNRTAVDNRVDKMVHNPHHYNHGAIEVIDIINAFGHLDYCLLNALKYILRAPFKGRQQDLEKAIWYLTNMKERMDKGEPGYYKRNKPEVTE